MKSKHNLYEIVSVVFHLSIHYSVNPITWTSQKKRRKKIPKKICNCIIQLWIQWVLIQCHTATVIYLDSILLSIKSWCNHLFLLYCITSALRQLILFSFFFSAFYSIFVEEKLLTFNAIISSVSNFLYEQIDEVRWVKCKRLLNWQYNNVFSKNEKWTKLP